MSPVRSTQMDHLSRWLLSSTNRNPYPSRKESLGKILGCFSRVTNSLMLQGSSGCKLHLFVEVFQLISGDVAEHNEKKGSTKQVG